jgi:hypothetical protein
VYVDTTVMNVLLGKPDGRSKVGRPKLRWLYYSESVLKWTSDERWEKDNRRQFCVGCHAEGGIG